MTSRRSSLKQLLALSATSGLAYAPFVRSAPRYKMRAANNALADHPLNVRLKDAFDEIRKETNGELDIELYPASQLGSDADVFSQVRGGVIELYIAGGAVMSTVAPLAGVTGVGYAFKDGKQVWSAMDGALGAMIREAFGKVGLHAMPRGFELGFRQITSSSKPIRNAADLERFKIRVPQSPLYVSLFRSLGAAPSSMNFADVYSSLQTRLIDGQENPLVVIEQFRFYEVQKYLTVSNHMWDGYWMVANDKHWQNLPAELRTLVETKAGKAAALQRVDMANLESKMIETLKGRGMELVAADVASFREKLSKSGYYGEWKKRIGAPAWAELERISGTLA